ncbi:hypothetical protein SASPL_149764 [Salvia splendens]|uniref:Transmembrane protein n=1 Tax=Salvia splendens TaxID=180675 RepID=A0A8X8W5N2_SALSN|nr:hypothetical protein SASPL_149764 [Salvia splendens]
MITRSKLAEQLREYQTRSKHDWPSFSLFSSTSNLASSRYFSSSLISTFSFPAFTRLHYLFTSLSIATSKFDLICFLLFHILLLSGCRVDVAIFVIWELVILAIFVFSVVSLYFRHLRLAVLLLCITLVSVLCMKITKQVRLARKKQRRMLLPLSM